MSIKGGNPDTGTPPTDPVPPPTDPVPPPPTDPSPPPPTDPGTAVTFELKGVIQEVVVSSNQLILQDSTVITITAETIVKFENGATAFAVDQKIEGKAIQTDSQLIATKIKAK
jgi:hypothetical protein